MKPEHLLEIGGNRGKSETGGNASLPLEGINAPAQNRLYLVEPRSK